MIFLVFSMLMCSCHADESFEDFWTGFKNDLLAENFDSLHNRIQFPLEMRGVSDHREPKMLTVENVNQYLKLSLDSYESEFINRKSVITPFKEAIDKFDGKVETPDDQYRFMNFYFIKENGEWILNHFFYDEDEQRLIVMELEELRKSNDTIK